MIVLAIIGFKSAERTIEVFLHERMRDFIVTDGRAELLAGSVGKDATGDAIADFEFIGGLGV